MIDQLQVLVEDIISDHWMKLAWFVVAALGLGAVKRWRDKRKWRLRQFLERVNCSLNVVEDGVLKIRTLFETILGEILLANHTAENLVVTRTYLRVGKSSRPLGNAAADGSSIPRRS